MRCRSSSRRRAGLLALFTVILVLARAPTPVAAAAPRALVVLPPGEGNTITLDEFLKNRASGDCADLGPHTCDQLELYKDWRFRDGSLAGDPDHVQGAVSEERPVDGLRLVRDRDGVPHVFATGPDEQTIEERLAYGIGYAQAEERLFQMDVLRRAAEGRLSELLGPTYLTMDAVTRRDSETDSERLAETEQYLTPGQQRSLQRYADGVNAVIMRDTTDPQTLPAGFILTQDLPISPWTPSDSVAIDILEIKAVAESAGNELGYGSLARRLAQHYGTDRAVAILDDIQLTGHPSTSVSVPAGQSALRSTDGQQYSFISYTRQDTAARIAELGPSVEPAMHEVQSANQAVAEATLALGLPHFGSNAWAVAPRKSATGRAMLWGAPQVSYYVPEVLDEMEVSGGLSHVRGVGVPGSGPAVVIGYTPHLAWSITTAQDDQVDTYVDRIRGSSSTGYEYWWKGSWHPVEVRTEVIRERIDTPNLPQAGTQALPVYTERKVTYYRTAHGDGEARLPCVVEYVDAAAGLAYCKVRAFWGAELLTGRSLVAASQATSVDGFDRAIRGGVAGFNFIYADEAGHIGYWHTGRVPLRVPGHDPRLPAPGDGSFDWRGYLDPALWPSVVDPAQGFVVSWNNKPQRSWPDSGDGTLWGANQRVAQPQQLLRSAGPLDQTGLYRVAMRTGELDLRATLGFKPFLTELAQRDDLTPLERAAVAEVAAWDGTAFYPDGAERTASGKETGNVAGAGFPIMSAWFHALESRAGSAVLLPVVDGQNVAAGVRAFTLTGGTTSPEFEFFDDYDAFLDDLLSGRARGAEYLAGTSVSDLSRAALDDAISRLRRSQGDDVSKWRAPMPQITFMALDVSDIGTIPWENRGTWGQVVAFGPAGGSAPGGMTSAVAAIPTTAAPAGGVGGLVAALSLLLVAVLRRRSRARCASMRACHRPTAASRWSHPR